MASNEFPIYVDGPEQEFEVKFDRELRISGGSGCFLGFRKQVTLNVSLDSKTTVYRLGVFSALRMVVTADTNTGHVYSSLHHHILMSSLQAIQSQPVQRRRKRVSLLHLRAANAAWHTSFTIPFSAVGIRFSRE